MKRVMKAKNYKTLDELEDKYFGKSGSPVRDQYEFELKMELLSNALRQIRKDRQLTQEELGKLIGVQKAQISKLEKSVNNVNLSTILKVFHALRTSINIIIKLENNQEISFS
jgi:HTH-type transcriptional regulator / antitoxin HipB